MPDKEKSRIKYFELAQSSSTQVIVFYLLIIINSLIAFFIFIPLFKSLIGEFLNGEVRDNHELITVSIHDEPQFNRVTEAEDWQDAMKAIMANQRIPLARTTPYSSWGVDLNVGSAEAVRYWINPILAISIPSAIVGIILTVFLTSWFPTKIGMFRRLIEREIVYSLDNICFRKNGYYSENENHEIAQSLLKSDIHLLHVYEKDWSIPIDNLKILILSLKWQQGSILYKFLNPLKGMTLYLRLYFTEKYSNPILGYVYIGAAMLIIIIGLRGLKFIPATHPSLVFFALGLEFSLLLFYAFTLIFSKPEDVDDIFDQNKEPNQSSKGLFEKGSGKEIENLLRVFIKTRE